MGCGWDQWKQFATSIPEILIYWKPVNHIEHLITKLLLIFCDFVGTPYTQQSYKVSESFPFKWINKKWKEGFYVTSMTTAGTRWAVVMSRNAGFSDQVFLSFDLYMYLLFSTVLHFWSIYFCVVLHLFQPFKVVELDFLYPSEGIHRRWESGYRITSMAATVDQAAFILSIPKRKTTDDTQETLRTTAFPSTHVKVGIPYFRTSISF